MIRLFAMGGLGNQLFQYAAVRAQAKRLNVAVEIDTIDYDEEPLLGHQMFWLDTLPIAARVLRYSKSGPFARRGIATLVQQKLIQHTWRRYNETKIFDQDPRFFQLRPHTVVQGYFQSLFYLLPRDEEILGELSLLNAASPQAIEHAQSIAGGEFVSIHVRRGDYLDYNGFEVTDFPLYLEAAMAFARSKLSQPRFLVFSDDIEWCKQQPLFRHECDFVVANRSERIFARRGRCMAGP